MISNVRLQHFRSYKDSAFEFGDGVNIIVGPNGSGKTNLLEALLVLARGGSYRVGDSDLMAFGADWSRIDGVVDGTQERSIILKKGAPLQKKHIVGAKTYTRLPEKQKLPIVLFEPNHLMLLQGPPEGRRMYLDDILEQIKPGYNVFRKNYKRVLSQRNTLLKTPHTTKQEFFPWNLRLSELGAVIYRARRELVDELSAHIQDTYKQLAATDTKIGVSYESRLTEVGYESQLMRVLEDNHHTDALRGFTSFGPHRDDIIVQFGGVPAALTASRGESRTATLALKILEAQIIERTRNQKPLMLLDDVFSELDGVRRRGLTKSVKNYQTLITTTDADVVIKHFSSSRVLPLGL